MDKFKIIRLTVEDWQSYHKLHMEALRDDERFFSMSVEEEMNRPEKKIKKELARRLIWGLYFDGELIGKIGLALRKRGRVKHVAKVFGLYVRASFRGQGFAKKLFAVVIDEIQARSGIEQLQLRMIKGNDVAMGFYKKLGFVEFGCEKEAVKMDGDYSDEIYMQKFLK